MKADDNHKGKSVRLGLSSGFAKAVADKQYERGSTADGLPMNLTISRAMSWLNIWFNI
jgi:hypothetical protein